MSKDEPYDKYKADIASDQHRIEQKFGGHAPPRRPSPKRPDDEELHRQAFERMARQPSGNPNPRRKDTLVLTVVPKPDRDKGPS